MLLKIEKEHAERLLSACRATVAEGREIAITGHDNPDTDSLISAYLMWKLLSDMGVPASIKFRSLPDSVSSRIARDILDYGKISFDGFAENDSLLLVDHHFSFADMPVFATIDHHTTPPEPAGSRFNLVTKASSCGRIICELMRAAGVLDGESERLALYSVYIDTVSCKSPKYDRSDDGWAEDIIERYDLDRRALEKLGYALNMPDEDADSVASCCFKKYTFAGKYAASNVIQTDNETEMILDTRIGEITDAIEHIMRKENIVFWVYVLNNAESTTSRLYFFEMTEEGLRLYDLVVRDRLASRSRDVIPRVNEYLERC